MITQTLQPFSNTTDEPPLYFMGVPTYLRATGQATRGGFGLVDSVLPPGFESPYHTHHLEDEAFYVVAGHMAFVCDGHWTMAGPGSFVFGPRNIPHGFKVVGDAPAHMLLLCTPGGFEQFVATTATQHGFVYGLITAFMALMTGWMASIVFRKD